MQLSLSFAEIHDYVSNHYDKNITLEYVSDKELSLTLTQHIFVKDIPITVNLRIDEVTPVSITFVYSGGLPVDMLISGALTFLKSRLHDVMAFISVEDKRRITIHLNFIVKLRPAISKIKLQDITVAPEALKLTASLPSTFETAIDQLTEIPALFKAIKSDSSDRSDRSDFQS